jgi:bacterial/archaeal transporter family-2 protein
MSQFFNSYIYLILALLAGMTMSTQGAVNTKLSGYVESPIAAGFISFAVGTIVLAISLIVAGVPLSSLANAKNAPPVAWIGGILGAFFVSAVATSVPKLGVALTFSLAVAGQLLVAITLDHFGLLGVPVKEISVIRILGVLLIMVGVVLIRKF